MADQKIAIGDTDIGTGLPYHGTWTPGDKLVDPDGNPVGGSIKFEELNDVPAYAGKAGYLYAVKATVDGIEHFPASLAGQSGKVIAVKATEDGFELILAGAGGGKELSPRHVVGLSNSPHSDVAADCDYLHENNAVLGNSPVTDGLGLAIAAAVADGFGEIYIRSGYYETEVPWIIYDTIKIIGEGRGNTRVKFIGDDYPNIIYISGSDGVIIEDITLEGPDGDQDVIAFIEITGMAYDTIFNRVDIVAGLGLVEENPGIYGSLLGCSLIDGLTMLNCRLNPLYEPLNYEIANIAESSRVRIERCKFYNASTSATIVYMSDMNQLHMYESHFKAHDSLHFLAYTFKYEHFTTSKDVYVMNNTFEGHVLFETVANFTFRNIRFDYNHVTSGNYILLKLRNMREASFSNNDLLPLFVEKSMLSLIEASGLQNCKVNKNRLYTYWNWSWHEGIKISSCYWTQFNENDISLSGEYSNGIRTIENIEHCEFNNNLIKLTDTRGANGILIGSGAGGVQYNSFNDNVISVSEYGEVAVSTGINIYGGAPDNVYVGNNILANKAGTVGFDGGNQTGLFNANQIIAKNGATHTANIGSLTAGVNRLA